MNTKEQKKNSVELTQENFANLLSPTNMEFRLISYKAFKAVVFLQIFIPISTIILGTFLHFLEYNKLPRLLERIFQYLF